MLRQPPMTFSTDEYAYTAEEQERYERARDDGNCNIRPGQRKRIEQRRQERTLADSGDNRDIAFDLGGSSFGENVIKQFVGVSPQSDRDPGNWMYGSESLSIRPDTTPACKTLHADTVESNIFEQHLNASEDKQSFCAQQHEKFSAAMCKISGTEENFVAVENDESALIPGWHLDVDCNESSEQINDPPKEQTELTNFLLSRYE